MYFENVLIENYLTQSDVFVFDLNGLIVDDEGVQLRATNDVLLAHGVQIDEGTWISKCVGHKPSEYIPSFLGHEIDVTDIVRLKDLIYSDYMMQEMWNLLRPGALQLIRHLRNNGRALALATSTTQTGVEAILGPTGLSLLNEFGVVVTGDQVSRAKPDPEIYELVRSRFADANRFTAFEDSEVGVISAIQSGMSCICVPNRFTKNQDISIASIAISNLLPSAIILT